MEGMGPGSPGEGGRCDGSRWVQEAGSDLLTWVVVRDCWLCHYTVYCLFHNF